MLSDDDRDVVEVERYELREPPAYAFASNRREFVQALGVGFVISVSAKNCLSQSRRNRTQRPTQLTERFHLGVDGVVTVFTGKVEVGQDARTQIAQASAEEFRLPIDRIRVVMADTELCPDDGGTAGSRTTPSTVPQVRRAAARAREVLRELAAQRLSVKMHELELKDGRFEHRTSDIQLTLAELAGLKELPTRLVAATPTQDVSLTPVPEWKTLGRPIAKITARDVVTGAAQYPSDIRRPHMLYGKVLRPSSINAKLRSIDLTPAKAMPGVDVVRDGEFVGCVANSSWRAAAAIDALASTAVWDRPPQVSSNLLYDHLKRTARRTGSGRSRPRVDTWGDFNAELPANHQTTSATYTIAYVQHAPMEPRAAVAEWNEGRLSVWTGTQQPMRVRSELMSAFRLGEESVRVVVPDTGGGFGGKHTGEAAVEAARLAKAVGQPVSLCWDRNEEFTWAYCRPAGVIEVAASLDDDGKLFRWDFTNYNSGGSAIGTPYSVPHGRTRFFACDSPLRQGSYRALASTANTFARESTMDDLASAAHADPLEFRLRHLPSGRLRDVLLDAAKQFGFAARRAQTRAGRGVGMACGTEKGSYVAACAEVEVSNGRFEIRSICQAYECGAIQNPANLKSQVEGCIIMGLGGALFEEMRFQDGMVSSNSFSEYQVPRMGHVPRIEVVLRNRPDLPSVGAGETPIIAVAPAIANAVYHACGERVRCLPLRSQNLTATS